jgi:phosphotransferase system HPr (HPr) family protein
VTITNRLGLHARPAMLLAELAQQFDAAVQLRRTDQDEAIDAKSIMQIMMLAATAGTEIEISANGDGAAEAVRELSALVAAGFDEQ